MTEKEMVLLSKLRWDAALKDQQQAFKEIVIDNAIAPQMLVRPISKSYWDNAAKVLKDMGYERVKHITYELLTWLQDYNWPGADTIIDLLKTFPNQELVPYYEKAIMDAISKNDELWLDYLSVFVFLKKITKSDFIHKELYDVMKKHEDQWIV